MVGLACRRLAQYWAFCAAAAAQGPVYVYSGREFQGASVEDVTSQVPGDALFGADFSFAFAVRFDSGNGFWLMDFATDTEAIRVKEWQGELCLETVWRGADSCLKMGPTPTGQEGRYLFTVAASGALNVYLNGSLAASGSAHAPGASPSPATRLRLGQGLYGRIGSFQLFNTVPAWADVDWAPTNELVTSTPEPPTRALSAPTPAPPAHCGGSYGEGNCMTRFDGLKFEWIQLWSYYNGASTEYEHVIKHTVGVSKVKETEFFGRVEVSVGFRALWGLLSAGGAKASATARYKTSDAIFVERTTTHTWKVPPGENVVCWQLQAVWKVDGERHTLPLDTLRLEKVVDEKPENVPSDPDCWQTARYRCPGSDVEAPTSGAGSGSSWRARPTTTVEITVEAPLSGAGSDSPWRALSVALCAALLR